MAPPTKEDLQAAFCWEADDQIPRRPEMTAFRREARYHQARWREANQHPIGTQPLVPKPGDTRVRSVGSRLPLEYARDTGANFLTSTALDAVRARIAYVEARQSVDQQRLWADLLSSMALSFNLFGDLAADPALADRAVHTWFPDSPGRVSELRFAHSPGWFDPAYINSLRSFATVFVLDLDDGSNGIVAVSVKYHERNKAETPRPENLDRYGEVAERSGAFAPGAIDTLEAARRSVRDMDRASPAVLHAAAPQRPMDVGPVPRRASRRELRRRRRLCPVPGDAGRRGHLRHDDPRTAPRFGHAPGADRRRAPRPLSHRVASKLTFGGQV